MANPITAAHLRRVHEHQHRRATGALETTVTLCTMPIEIVEPSAWKRHFRLPGKDKDLTRQRALEIFPAAHALLARKKNHNRAEAALLALYGIRVSRLMTAPPGAQPGLNIKQTA